MKVTSINKSEDQRSPRKNLNTIMCIVPGPALQDVIFKRIFGSLVLQCMVSLRQVEPPRLQGDPTHLQS
jgi:hypothetical protein